MYSKWVGFKSLMITLGILILIVIGVIMIPFILTLLTVGAIGTVVYIAVRDAQMHDDN